VRVEGVPKKGEKMPADFTPKEKSMQAVHRVWLGYYVKEGGGGEKRLHMSVRGNKTLGKKRGKMLPVSEKGPCSKFLPSRFGKGGRRGNSKEGERREQRSTFEKGAGDDA